MTFAVCGRLVDSHVLGATDDVTLVVPKNHFIKHILIINNNANAITGGLKFGTTSGATDVVAAQAVGASAIVTVSDATLLKRFFSKSADQNIFVQDVTAWNSANVDIHLLCTPVA